MPGWVNSVTIEPSPPMLTRSAGMASSKGEPDALAAIYGEISGLTLSPISPSMQLISPEVVYWVSQKFSLTWWPSMPPLALSASIAATMPASNSGKVRTWEVSGPTPPTTIADDEDADEESPAPVVDAVVGDDELLQAAAASATAPTAAAICILRMRLLDMAFPFACLLVSCSGMYAVFPDRYSGFNLFRRVCRIYLRFTSD